MASTLNELIADVANVDANGPIALGTAEWMGFRDAKKLDYARQAEANPDHPIWLGQDLDDGRFLGFGDDRHVNLISGTRGGKGTGIIVPTLCLWPGSCIVIDPKGENAAVTARRRANGSEFSDGLGQHVCILDPMREIKGLDDLQACFNPLDLINDVELAVDDAGRMAAALIVNENTNDPYWELAARNLVKCLILHILTHAAYAGRRNLLTLRILLTRGDIFTLEQAREQDEPDAELPSAPDMLIRSMRQSAAFDGVVASGGDQLKTMPDKTRAGVLEIARTNTAFMDGRPMQRLLAKSDFKLEELKTNPDGFTLYLTLPTRYQEEHFRWLRLMITLAIGEMERVKQKPATGHRTLFLLDEFQGLKRMEVVENAVAQAAGFGVKFFFVVQNYSLLKKIYEDAWENFVSNCGLKIFFQIDDNFTRDYLSRLLGEREVRRVTHSDSEADSRSETFTDGDTETDSSGTSRSRTKGESVSYQFSDDSLFPHRQMGTNRSVSASTTEGTSSAHTTSTARGDSRTATTGTSDTVHKRPLLTSDEIGLCLSRIDDREAHCYPGALVAIIPGKRPLLARRVNYHESVAFDRMYDPHPEHKRPKTKVEHEAAAKDKAAEPVPQPPLIALPAFHGAARRLLPAAAVILVAVLGYVMVGAIWRNVSGWLSRTAVADTRSGLSGVANVTGTIESSLARPIAAALGAAKPVLSKILSAPIGVPQPSRQQLAAMTAPTVANQATETRGRESLPQLEAAARSAIVNFYFDHGSQGNADATQLLALYAPVVDFYGRSRAASAFMPEKLKIASAWPVRRFAFKGAPNVSCNVNSQLCTVSGRVQFDFENPQRASRGLSSFRVTFADLGGQEKVVAENGKVEQRF